MHDMWTDRLSEYLNGEMERSERETLEGHLADCASCSALLSDLETVRALARDRKEMPVPEEIWPRIERAIAQGGATREPGDARIRRVDLPARARFSITLPELLAACLVAAILSGGTVFAVLRHQPARVVIRPYPVARTPERSDATPTTTPRPEPSTPATTLA